MTGLAASTPGPGAVPQPPVVNLGAVFTKRWVVDLILDLAGYTPDKDLASGRAIEPSVGHGAFIVPMVDRLFESCAVHGRALESVGDAIRGYDIDQTAVEACRAQVRSALRGHQVPAATARRLAEKWIRQGDFLDLAVNHGAVTWVIGNPPYVRIEDVDKVSLARYRAAWPTMSGRADLYVGFLEAGLAMLEPGGRLAVICADRWMRNRYGAGLREVVENDPYAMDACVVLHDVAAFEDQVAAYPAISVIRAGEQGHALVAEAEPTFDEQAATRLLDVWGRGPAPIKQQAAFRASWTNGWFSDNGSWPAGRPEQLAILAKLESQFPTLEDSGSAVSVGIATGADDVYVTATPGETEPSRLVKAISAREVSTGQISWGGKYLVNPWQQDGLVSLTNHPGMRAYLYRHGARLRARHVAKKHPDVWWRTIDRLKPHVAAAPKLLIPDLKDRIHPVLDEGEYCPTHSLYYVTSDLWDLEVLGGLLLSDVANLFVEAYSVRMASGYLRVSAQYLRRVRVPEFASIKQADRRALTSAFRARDVQAATQLARRLYGLDS